MAASHGYIVLRWIVDAVAERILWRGSAEEAEVQRLTERGSRDVHERIKQLSGGSGVRKVYQREEKGVFGHFWNGGEEGARAVGSVGKAE